MVMIVLCHYFQYYDCELAWWLNVGVQIFLVVSGYLYGNKDINDPVGCITKQFKKILIPYYCLLLPVILLYIIFSPKNISAMGIINAIFCVGTLNGIGHLWFVGYILFCYLITPYLYSLREKTIRLSAWKFIFVWITVLSVGILLGLLINTYFSPDRICCFVIGYFLSVLPSRFPNVGLKISAFIFGIFALATNFLKIHSQYFSNIVLDGIWLKIFEQIKKYAHVFLGVFLFIALLLLLKKARMNFVLKISDKYSYFVYLVHQVFILSPFSLMGLTSIQYLNWFLVLLAIAISAVILQFMSQKLQYTIFKRR